MLMNWCEWLYDCLIVMCGYMTNERVGSYKITYGNKMYRLNKVFVPEVMDKMQSILSATSGERDITVQVKRFIEYYDENKRTFEHLDVIKDYLGVSCFMLMTNDLEVVYL
jgi:hypothetical protein